MLTKRQLTREAGYLLVTASTLLQTYNSDNPFLGVVILATFLAGLTLARKEGSNA